MIGYGLLAMVYMIVGMEQSDNTWDDRSAPFSATPIT